MNGQIVTLVGLALMVGLLAFASGCSDDLAPRPNIGLSPELAADVGLSRDDPVPRGHPFVVPQGWQITVGGFRPDATEEILQYSLVNDLPSPGFRYVLVRVRMINISDRDPDRFLPLRFLNLIGSRNILYKASWRPCSFVPDAFGELDDRIWADLVNAFVEGTEGNVCFEVGKTETDLVLFTGHFDPLSSSVNQDQEDRRWFAVQ